MKPTMAVFRQFIRRELRDRYSLFWNMAFPLILMTFLVLIFGNMSEVGTSMVFQVGLVNHNDPSASPLGEFSISRTLEDIFVEMAAEDDSWLKLHLPGDDETPSDFLASELNQLERGNRHAVLVIPEVLDQQVYQEIMAHYSPFMVQQGAGEVVVYSRPGAQMSAVAADILAQIVSRVNTVINSEAGLIDSSGLVELRHHQVKPTADPGNPFNFADYLLPGIILMAFLGSGLELVVERLTLYRERGILRRYFATPLRPAQYSLGLLLHITVLSMVQVVLVYVFGAYVFGVDIPLFSPLPLFYLVFSLATLLSIGLLIATVSKTANAANTLTNALRYPLMFLGGLYFPVTGMPFPISLFVLGNPVTYLINGLRDSLGVFPSPTSSVLNVVVPALWTIVALIYGFRRFRWD